MEAVLEIPSRQYKPNIFFDLADTDKQTVVRRGKKQTYTLAPVDEDDDFFSPELEAKIEKAMWQIENGECTVIKNKEELRNYFDNL